MAELRRDPIVGRMVVIAPERSARPQEFVDRPHAERSASCPFCAGSEAETPHEIAALRDSGTSADGPGWRVRVIPNKYSALHPFSSETEINRVGDNRKFTTSETAVGVHEVIIESPEHLSTTGSLSGSQLTDVLKVYRDRLRIHRADPRLRYVQIFKNVGEAAGASIEHLHSQLMGLEFVPAAIESELAGCRDHHARTGRCLFCDLVEQELAAGVRVVAESDDVVAFCPYASRFPYEVWFIPRRHAARFEDSDDRLLAATAECLLGVVRGIEKLFGTVGRSAVGYNYLLHSAPFDSSEPCYYHWHIEVLPREVKQAGFEWATGVHINPVAPEEAAAVLRRLSSSS